MGGSSIVILKLMKEFDLCNRQFWAFDSFIGLPPLREDDKKLTFGSDSQMVKQYLSLFHIFDGPFFIHCFTYLMVHFYFS